MPQDQSQGCCADAPDTLDCIQPSIVIFICTYAANAKRRHAIRRSWMQFMTAADSPLTEAQRQSVDIVFIASMDEEAALAEEVSREGDILLLGTPEGYHNLWRKALTFLQHLQQWSVAAPGDRATQPGWRPRVRRPDFVMHADDDSYLRLDLLLARMVTWPGERFYWGYIWNTAASGAQTEPIRNPLNKSHMPVEQYELDYYPPFASGCGFVLSWDLVLSLAQAAPSLPDYRLLDPPFGIHLCGPPDRCLLQEPIVPVHDKCVRPYRPLPTFRSNTVVQHYLKPEEFVPYHKQAMQSLRETEQAGAGCSGGSAPDPLAGGSAAAEALYTQLVSLGVLRR